MPLLIAVSLLATTIISSAVVMHQLMVENSRRKILVATVVVVVTFIGTLAAFPSQWQAPLLSVGCTFIGALGGYLIVCHDRDPKPNAAS